MSNDKHSKTPLAFLRAITIITEVTNRQTLAANDITEVMMRRFRTAIRNKYYTNIPVTLQVLRLRVKWMTYDQSAQYLAANAI